MKSRLIIAFAGVMLALTSGISPTLALKSSSQTEYKAGVQDTDIIDGLNTTRDLIVQRRRRRVFVTRCGKWYRSGGRWRRRCRRLRCLSYRRRSRIWNSRTGRYVWRWRWTRPRNCVVVRRYTQTRR